MPYCIGDCRFRRGRHRGRRAEQPPGGRSADDTQRAAGERNPQLRSEPVGRSNRAARRDRSRNKANPTSFRLDDADNPAAGHSGRQPGGQTEIAQPRICDENDPGPLPSPASLRWAPAARAVRETGTKPPAGPRGSAARGQAPGLVDMGQLGQAGKGVLLGRAWVAARSFDVDDVVEPMNPVGEPIRQAVLGNTRVEFGRGALKRPAAGQVFGRPPGQPAAEPPGSA
jgi:hypothetical protein